MFRKESVTYDNGIVTVGTRYDASAGGGESFSFSNHFLEQTLTVTVAYLARLVDWPVFGKN